jgi:hypothetical protein
MLDKEEGAYLYQRSQNGLFRSIHSLHTFDLQIVRRISLREALRLRVTGKEALTFAISGFSCSVLDVISWILRRTRSGDCNIRPLSAAFER